MCCYRVPLDLETLDIWANLFQFCLHSERCWATIHPLLSKHHWRVACCCHWFYLLPGNITEATDWHRVAVFREGLRQVVLERVKKGYVYSEVAAGNSFAASRTRKSYFDLGFQKLCTTLVCFPIYVFTCLLLLEQSDSRFWIRPSVGDADFTARPLCPHPHNLNAFLPAGCERTSCCCGALWSGEKGHALMPLGGNSVSSLMHTGKQCATRLEQMEPGPILMLVARCLQCEQSCCYNRIFAS